MGEKKEYIIEFAEDPAKCYLVLLKNDNGGLPFMKKRLYIPTRNLILKRSGRKSTIKDSTHNTRIPPPLKAAG